MAVEKEQYLAFGLLAISFAQQVIDFVNGITSDTPIELNDVGTHIKAAKEKLEAAIERAKQA